MNSKVSRAAIVFAVLTLSLLAVWLFAVPGLLSYSTFAFLAVIVLGAAGVALMTWRNAQATEGVAQILHTAETTPASTAASGRAQSLPTGTRGA